MNTVLKLKCHLHVQELSAADCLSCASTSVYVGCVIVLFIRNLTSQHHVITWPFPTRSRICFIQRDLRLPAWCSWGLLSSGMLASVGCWIVTDVSRQPVNYISRNMFSETWTAFYKPMSPQHPRKRKASCFFTTQQEWGHIGTFRNSNLVRLQ
jgi:hypothetical protein